MHDRKKSHFKAFFFFKKNLKLSKDHRKEEESDKHKHKEAKLLKIRSKRNYDADAENDCETATLNKEFKKLKGGTNWM